MGKSVIPAMLGGGLSPRQRAGTKVHAVCPKVRHVAGQAGLRCSSDRLRQFVFREQGRDAAYATMDHAVWQLK